MGPLWRKALLPAEVMGNLPGGMLGDRRGGAMVDDRRHKEGRAWVAAAED